MASPDTMQNRGIGRRSAKGRPLRSVSTAAQAVSASWASRGACLDSDPELFFPIGLAGPALQQIARAKAVCERCTVRIDCLSYALSTGQDAGVWGGTTEEERREIRAATTATGIPRPRR